MKHIKAQGVGVPLEMVVERLEMMRGFVEMVLWKLGFGTIINF